MQVHNLFVNRFCFGLLAVWEANGQDNSHKQTTENYQPTKQPMSSNSSESGQIAIKQAIHLRVIRLLPTDRTIDQTIGQIRAQV